MVLKDFLFVIIVIPLISGALCLFDRSEKQLWIKRFSIFVSVVELILVVILLSNYTNLAYGNFQFETYIRWFNAYDIFFHIGVDLLSLIFIALSAFFILLLIVYTIILNKKGTHIYLISLLFLEGLLIGLFSALDMLLFYVIYTLIIIVLYVMIKSSETNKENASYKFSFYLISSALIFFASVLYVLSKANTTDIPKLMNLLSTLKLVDQYYIWGLMFVPFAITIGLWPFHRWIIALSSRVSIISIIFVISIFTKVGLYGLIRFPISLLPKANIFYSGLMYIVCIFISLYFLLVAFVEKTPKLSLLYMSLASISYVALGLFVNNIEGLYGAIIHLINYNLAFFILFLLLNALIEQNYLYVGNDTMLSRRIPRFFIAFIGITLVMLSVPGTSGFIGKWLILLGTWKVNKAFSVIAISEWLVMAACFISLYTKIFFEKPQRLNNHKLKDISFAETALVIVLLTFVVGIGLYPKIIIQITEHYAVGLIKHVSKNSL